MKISNDQDKIEDYLSQYGWSDMFSAPTLTDTRLCIYEPDEYIFRGGEQMNWFYLYVAGKSKVYRILENGKIMLVCFYRPFQVLGDAELFLQSESISFVKSISQVSCLRIPMSTIRRELDENIPLLNHLGRALAGKLASFNSIAAINQNYTLEIRLAAYLSMIYLEGDEYKEKKEGMETENLGEMAELLSCSYRHLTRTLEDLKNRKIIKKEGKKIRILNPRKLKTMAQDVYL